MEATIPALNIGNYLQVSMAPYPKRLESSSSLLWKPQISHVDQYSEVPYVRFHKNV